MFETSFWCFWCAQNRFVKKIKEFKTVLVKEVVKIILDFLNSPNKLVFVWIYRSTIIGVVGPPYPYGWLVAFYAFTWLRPCAFGDFDACKFLS